MPSIRRWRAQECSSDEVLPGADPSPLSGRGGYANIANDPPALEVSDLDMSRCIVRGKAAEVWDAGPGDCPVVLVLDDGTKLFPSCDPEGNGPAALFGVDSHGESFGIAPAANR